MIIDASFALVIIMNILLVCLFLLQYSFCEFFVSHQILYLHFIFWILNFHILYSVCIRVENLQRTGRAQWLLTKFPPFDYDRRPNLENPRAWRPLDFYDWSWTADLSFPSVHLLGPFYTLTSDYSGYKCSHFLEMVTWITQTIQIFFELPFMTENSCEIRIWDWLSLFQIDSGYTSPIVQTIGRNFSMKIRLLRKMSRFPARHRISFHQIFRKKCPTMAEKN